MSARHLFLKSLIVLEMSDLGQTATWSQCPRMPLCFGQPVNQILKSLQPLHEFCIIWETVLANFIQDINCPQLAIPQVMMP